MDPAPQLPANYEADAYSVFLDSLDYLSPDEIERVKRAFDFAARAHTQLPALAAGLKEGTYRPGPVKRQWIPKKTWRKRIGDSRTHCGYC